MLIKNKHGQSLVLFMHEYIRYVTLLFFITIPVVIKAERIAAGDHVG